VSLPRLAAGTFIRAEKHQVYFCAFNDAQPICSKMPPDYREQSVSAASG
jgi:hypothetical protein